jgi:hypothetical protein
MKAVSLLIVLVVSRILATAGHHLQISSWSLVAYLWHDAVIVLVFAAFEVALRRHTRIAWTAYACAATMAA